MTKFYILSIFAALFFFTFATSYEIYPLTSTNALENPPAPHFIPQVLIAYPLSKPKVSPEPSPNKSLLSHLVPKSSTITTRQSQSSWGPIAPKSSIKRNLSPKPFEKLVSSPKSNVEPRPAPIKYIPTHLAPKIPVNKENLSSKSSSKSTRKHLSKLFLVRPKVGSHVSSKMAPSAYKQKMNPKLAPKSTRKVYFNTHLAPKSTVTKPNIHLKPRGKVITKERLAPTEAPRLAHKRTFKRGTY